jgi:hypothetical protein
MQLLLLSSMFVAQAKPDVLQMLIIFAVSLAGLEPTGFRWSYINGRVLIIKILVFPAYCIFPILTAKKST